MYKNWKQLEDLLNNEFVIIQFYIKQLLELMKRFYLSFGFEPFVIDKIKALLEDTIVERKN